MGWCYPISTLSLDKFATFYYNRVPYTVKKKSNTKLTKLSFLEGFNLSKLFFYYLKKPSRFGPVGSGWGLGRSRVRVWVITKNLKNGTYYSPAYAGHNELE